MPQYLVALAEADGDGDTAETLICTGPRIVELDGHLVRVDVRDIGPLVDADPHSLQYRDRFLWQGEIVRIVTRHTMTNFTVRPEGGSSTGASDFTLELKLCQVRKLGSNVRIVA